MIRVRFDLKAEGSRPELVDVYTVFAHVWLETNRVVINGATVQREGSTVPKHAIAEAELAQVFHIDRVRQQAIEEAIASDATCRHCEKAEAVPPSSLCGLCVVKEGPLSPGAALTHAETLLTGVRALNAEPVLTEETAPLVRAAEALVADAMARVIATARSTSSETVAA